MIFIIAWRNIFRHKGKTLVIGTILFLGTLIMTIGNGIISGLNKGLEKNLVNSFTADILLISENQKNDDVLLSMSGQTIEPITNYLEIKKKLSKITYIKEFMPGGIGYVWVLNEKGQPIDQYVLGVNFSEYYEFFNQSISTIEGRLLQDNERGVLVPTKMREWLYDYCNYWVIPQQAALNKDNLTAEAQDDLKKYKRLDLRTQLVFMGLSKKNSTLDILSDVKGIIKFRSLNSLLGFYSILDTESFRECMGYFTAQDAKVTLDKEQQDLLDLNEEDLLDSYDSSFTTVVADESLYLDKSIFQKIDKPITNTVNVETGIYNLVFIKLAQGTGLNEALQKLNELSKDNNLQVRAISWDKAIGMMGQMSLIMKGALLLFVGFIFFVAIIIIMNTLIIAAMERISEIGMMRAVGARKSFITKIFLCETFILSLTFGGFGILMGYVAVQVLASLNITTENEILQIFYGGTNFHPFIGIETFNFCLLQLAIVTLLSVIYPIMIARKITALEAIARD